MKLLDPAQKRYTKAISIMDNQQSPNPLTQGPAQLSASSTLTLAQIESIAKGAISVSDVLPSDANGQVPSIFLNQPQEVALPAPVATPPVAIAPQPASAVTPGIEAETPVPPTRTQTIQQKVVEPVTSAPAVIAPTMGEVVQPEGVSNRSDFTSPPPVVPPDYLVATKPEKVAENPQVIGVQKVTPPDELTKEKAVVGHFGASNSTIHIVRMSLVAALLLILSFLVYLLIQSGQLAEWTRTFITEPIRKMSQP